MSMAFDETALEERPEIDLSVFGSVRPDREAPVVLALDIGTSGARAALFDSHGEEIEGSFVSRATEAYAALIAGEDVNADKLVESVGQVLDLANERANGVVTRVEYVAVSSFWHSLVGVDESSRAVTPLLGWAETRASEAVAQLKSRLNEIEAHARTGCRFHPSYWPSKILRLKRENRNLSEQVNRWLSFADYLSLKFFGDPMTSLSMASGTGLLNQTTREWDESLLDAVGISEPQMPRIAAQQETLRTLDEEYVGRWPLLDHAAWFPAIGDGAANNIGSGCINNQCIGLMLGTSGAMRVLFDGRPPARLPAELFCYQADQRRVVVGGALSDGGGLQRWIKERFAPEYGDDLLNERIAHIEPDSHGLIVLPFWSGERSTGWSSSARGAIVGLSAGTTSFEIMRAVMEAVSYRFALIARALHSFAPAASIRATGKIFHAYPCWAQIIADVLGKRIELSSGREVTLRGAALLALETIGTIDNLEPFKPDIRRLFLPDRERHEIYQRAIKRQEDLYQRLITNRVK